MSTLEILQSIIREEFKHSAAQLGPEATLAELGIDSLELVDLIFKIEDRFGLKVKEDVPRSLVSLGDVAAYVDELLAQQAAERRSAAERPP